MAKRNLQNANNHYRSRSRGFFDIDRTEADEAICESADDTVYESSVEAKTEKSAECANKSGSDASVSERRFAVIVAVFLSVTVLFSAAAYFISKLDFVVNSDYGENGNETNNVPQIVFEIYEPDWDTDIFTLEEYLLLNPNRIEYSDDQGHSYSRVDPEDLERVGGAKLVFLNSYFDAVKRGDHEAVNAMLTENYIKENGKYEPFPMQKIFDIKIERKYHNDPAFDNSKYDDYYFVVRYNIYRNDGMFRNDCDDQYYCRTLMRVLVDEEGNGFVDMIINYQGS